MFSAMTTPVNLGLHPAAKNDTISASCAHSLGGVSMRSLTVLLALGVATIGLYSAEPHQFTDAQKKFWSLQPVSKPAVPAAKNPQWVKTPIDSFILAKLTA